MRILIVASRRLFAESTDRSPAPALDAALRASGYATARLELAAPPGDRLEPLIGLDSLALDVATGQWPDLVVALDHLAALLRHPRRVLWAVQPIRPFAGGLRRGAARALLDHRTGRELAACFAASAERAGGVARALHRPAALLPVPAADDDDAWRRTVKRLVAAGVDESAA